jgi:hypothetical protein
LPAGEVGLHDGGGIAVLTGGTVVVSGGSVVVVVVLDVDVDRAEVLVPPPLHAENASAPATPTSAHRLIPRPRKR